MGKSYKNFWSLNVDEALATGILRDYFKKKAEVFMPLNAQLKDIDLIIANIKGKKIATIQVKGSKCYEPSKKEKSDFGDGSCGWFFPKESVIRDCVADYMIFLTHVIVDDKRTGRRRIEQHVITIRPSELYDICKKDKILHKNYCFFIWVNPILKKTFDYRDRKHKGIIDLDRYLDERGLAQIADFLGINAK